MSSVRKGLIAITIFLAATYLLIFFYGRSQELKIQEIHGKKLVWLERGDVSLLSGHEPWLWAPGSRVQAIKENIYDVTYQLDEWSLRKTSVNSPKKAHLVLTADSLIFGEGLSDAETLPSQLNLPEVNIRNVSFMGGGLQTTLRYFERVPFETLLPETEGEFFYFFFHDHLARFFARPSYLYWALPEMPHYEIRNGLPVYQGPIGETESFKNFGETRRIGLSHLALTYQELRRNNEIWSDDELRLFANSVRELKERYQKARPRGRFYFVIHPLYDPPATYLARLKKICLEKEIELLDPRSEFKREADGTIPGDGHPSGKFNQLLARWIQKTIQRSELSVRKTGL